MPKKNAAPNAHREKPSPSGRSADLGQQSAGLAYESVARLAYSYWEARAGQGGSPEEDWFKAESELRMNATPTQ